MQIIHVVLGKANPDRMNGVNKMVNELVSRQVAAGMNASLWGIAADTIHNYPDRNYATMLFKRSRMAFALPEGIEQAVDHIDGPVVFHLHGGFVPQMYQVAMLLKRRQLNYVLTPHGAYNILAMEKSKYMKRLYQSLFETKLIRNAGCVHIIGQSEQAGIQTLMPGKKTAHIPYGFSQAYQPGITVKTNDRFIIGYCGRIDIYTKGLDVLIHGFQQFHREYPDAALWIVGDGNQMPELKRIINETGLKDSIILHGALYGSGKEAILRQCTVFAHPSRNEGLPASVLEAAALGLPCLVTQATNMGDCVAQYDAGCVIPEAHEAWVYNALIILYNKCKRASGYAALQYNARKMVAQGFNWERLLVSYQQMYQKHVTI